MELEERLRAVEGELRAKWEAMQQEVNTFRLHRDAWTSAFSEIDQLTQTVLSIIACSFALLGMMSISFSPPFPRWRSQWSRFSKALMKR